MLISLISTPVEEIYYFPADFEFMFNLTMSDFPVPMEPADTTTLQDYIILRSVNRYAGNFNITI